MMQPDSSNEIVDLGLNIAISTQNMAVIMGNMRFYRLSNLEVSQFSDKLK